MGEVVAILVLVMAPVLMAGAGFAFGYFVLGPLLTGRNKW
jgi:hypothetical protein